MKFTLNKWTNGLVPAILLYISLGLIYCWSMIKGEVAYVMGCATSEIEIAFSLSLLCLGLTAMFVGRLVDYNEKMSAGISTLLFGAGMCGSIYAITNGIPWLFILMYGVVQGIALGIGYLSPIKTLMKWFDDRKGIALGLALMAFASSKIIFSPIVDSLLNEHHVVFVMFILGMIGIILMCIATLLLKAPCDIEHEKFSWKDFKKNILNIKYISIWGMILFITASSVAVISYEKEMLLHIDIIRVTLAITLLAVCNVLGRLIMPVVTNRIHIKENSYVYMLFFCVLVVVIAMIKLNPVTLLLMMAIANFCYGGAYGSVPILLHDKFGYKHMSLLHGIILGAWAIGGFFGNMFANFLFELLGSGGHIELIRKFFVFYMVAFIIFYSGMFNDKK